MQDVNDIKDKLNTAFDLRARGLDLMVERSGEAIVVALTDPRSSWVKACNVIDFDVLAADLQDMAEHLYHGPVTIWGPHQASLA
jgi:hypothetical protein